MKWTQVCKITKVSSSLKECQFQVQGEFWNPGEDWGGWTQVGKITKASNGFTLRMSISDVMPDNVRDAGSAFWNPGEKSMVIAYVWKTYQVSRAKKAMAFD